MDEIYALEEHQPGILEQMWEEEQRTPGCLMELCAKGVFADVAAEEPEQQGQGDIEQGKAPEKKPLIVQVRKAARRIRRRRRKQSRCKCICMVFVGLLVAVSVGYYVVNLSDFDDSEDW